MLHSLRSTGLRHCTRFPNRIFNLMKQGNGVFLQNVLFVKHCTDHKIYPSTFCQFERFAGK